MSFSRDKEVEHSFCENPVIQFICVYIEKWPSNSIDSCVCGRKVPLLNATQIATFSVFPKKKNIFVPQANTFSHRVRVRLANNFYSSHSFHVIFTSFEVVFDLQSSFTTENSKEEKKKTVNRVF